MDIVRMKRMVRAVHAMRNRTTQEIMTCPLDQVVAKTQEAIEWERINTAMVKQLQAALKEGPSVKKMGDAVSTIGRAGLSATVFPFPRSTV